MVTRQKKRGAGRGFVREHSLSLTVVGILIAWFVLYARADPNTHLGAFYGNALADWLGTLILVMATKHLYEIGSAQSRTPHPASRSALMRFLIDHSLTIGLVITGVMWAGLYSGIDSNGKAGQVVGNIVSEWTQILGIVMITKYTRETGSKESRR
jgi:hypothetical protein